jgi:O-antigen/teichoic acid export membrane protein
MTTVAAVSRLQAVTVPGENQGNSIHNPPTPSRMRFRSQLASAVVIQGAGAVAALLASVMISRRYGPGIQGSYVSSRSWIDLASQVAVFGLPQAFTHALSSGSLTVPEAAHINGALLAALILVAFLCAKAGVIPLLAAAGMLAATIHMLFRPLVLAARPSPVFNLISIFPNLCLLAGTFLITLGGYSDVQVLIAGSFALGAILTLSVIGSELPGRWFSWPCRSGIRRITTYGLWSAITPLALQATITGTYQILSSSRDGAVLTGLFSLPVLLITSATVPLNMVAPLLFKRWAADFAQERSTASFSTAARYAAILSLAATPGFVLGSTLLLTRVFGAKFEPAIAPCLVLSCSTYGFLMSRLLGTALLAFGSPRLYALSSVARAAVIFLLLWAGWRRSLVGCALSWAVGDGVTLLLSAAGIARVTGISLAEAIGLRLHLNRTELVYGS